MTGGAPRRVVFVSAGVVFGVLAIVFVVTSLIDGAYADACAEELAGAIAKRDLRYVERAVRNPSVRDVLLAADHVEVGFVRPISSEWARIGLFVRKTATSTSMQAVVLQLSTDSSEGCMFLRDYEAGPFGGGES